MKKFVKKYNIPLFYDKDFDIYHHDLNYCIFDIETTGLSAQRGNKIIMTACMTASTSGSKITQFLAETPFEEDRVLIATWNFFVSEKIDCLITYNGSTFDIPFFKQRLYALKLPFELNIFDFDLYNFLRANTDLNKRIGSLSQKNLESLYNISSNRKDVISGRESVKLFSQYAIDNNPVIEKIILTHNREDVLQLNNILRTASQNGFSELLATRSAAAGSDDDDSKSASSLDAALARSGAGLQTAGGELTVRQKLAGRCLTLAGRQLRAPHLQIENAKYLNANYFQESEADISIEFNAESKSYQIKIPLSIHGESKYLDIKKFLFETESSTDKNQLYLAKLIKDSDYLINDYIVLVNNGKTLHREINLTSMLISSQIYEKIRLKKLNLSSLTR